MLHDNNNNDAANKVECFYHNNYSKLGNNTRCVLRPVILVILVIDWRTVLVLLPPPTTPTRVNLLMTDFSRFVRA